MVEALVHPSLQAAAEALLVRLRGLGAGSVLWLVPGQVHAAARRRWLHARGLPLLARVTTLEEAALRTLAPPGTRPLGPALRRFLARREIPDARDTQVRRVVRLAQVLEEEALHEDPAGALRGTIHERHGATLAALGARIDGLAGWAVPQRLMAGPAAPSVSGLELVVVEGVTHPSPCQARFLQRLAGAVAAVFLVPPGVVLPAALRHAAAAVSAPADKHPVTRINCAAASVQWAAAAGFARGHAPAVIGLPDPVPTPVGLRAALAAAGLTVAGHPARLLMDTGAGRALASLLEIRGGTADTEHVLSILWARGVNGRARARELDRLPAPPRGPALGEALRTNPRADRARQVLEQADRPPEELLDLLKASAHVRGNAGDQLRDAAATVAAARTLWPDAPTGAQASLLRDLLEEPSSDPDAADVTILSVRDALSGLGPAAAIAGLETDPARAGEGLELPPAVARARRGRTRAQFQALLEQARHNAPVALLRTGVEAGVPWPFDVPDATDVDAPAWTARALLARVDAARHADPALATDATALEAARAARSVGPATGAVGPQPLPPHIPVGLLERLVICPFQTWASDILGLEPPPRDGEEPGPADAGRLVHRVLKDALERFQDRELAEVPPAQLEHALLEAALAQFATQTGRATSARYRAWMRRQLAGLGTPETNPHHAGPPGALKTAAAQIQSTGGRVRAVERPVRLDVAGATVVGRLDRLDELPDGSLRVVDYKTGRATRYTKASILKGQWLQLPLYALAVGTAGPPVRELMIVRVHPPLQSSEESPAIRAEPEDPHAFLDEVRKWVAEALETYANGRFTTTNLPHDVAGCQYCTFRHGCRRPPEEGPWTGGLPSWLARREDHG